MQDADEDRAELGMAANSILQSIPPHVLKALEQQQVEANAVNAESKVHHPRRQLPYGFIHRLSVGRSGCAYSQSASIAHLGRSTT